MFVLLVASTYVFDYATIHCEIIITFVVVCDLIIDRKPLIHALIKRNIKN